MTLALLKLALVVFMAGNLLDMGLRLNPRDALRGLRNVRFVAYTLIWGFALVPALAVGIPQLVPLDRAYATGLVLLGLTPCAPFLPALGDIGFTAAFMFLTAVGNVVAMPIAVPILISGLTVSTWAIARPLLVKYFHGDNGTGLGASHQTGWTGVVAKLMELFGRLDAQQALIAGKRSAHARGRS